VNFVPRLRFFKRSPTMVNGDVPPQLWGLRIIDFTTRFDEERHIRMYPESEQPIKLNLTRGLKWLKNVRL
jgi:hypothetical protein